MAQRPAIVCVRDPDASNDYAFFDADGNRVGYDDVGVDVIDVDLGYADLNDDEEFFNWAEGVLSSIAQQAEGVRQHVLRIVVNESRGRLAPCPHCDLPRPMVPTVGVPAGSECPWCHHVEPEQDEP